MITPMFLIPILMASVFFLIRAEFAHRHKQIYVLKPISTVLVICIASLFFTQGNQSLSYIKFILMGLVFSLGGDLALMFPKNRKAFSVGLGLFLSAHIIYAIAFIRIGQFSMMTFIPVVAMLIIGLKFYQLIQEKLGSMKFPVIAYILIISIMVVSATLILQGSVLDNSQALMVLSGAVLFYISDLILAANRFWKEWAYNRISLAFYYGGQLLLALSTGFMA